MKRFVLSVLAVLAIAITVVGCGSSNTARPTPVATPTPTPTPSPTPSNTELEGMWIGMPKLPDNTTMQITFVFTGNNWISLSSKSDSDQMSGTFIIDTMANPKTIDLYIANASEESHWAGGTSLGIYVLNGSNLKLEVLDPGDARLTEFTEYYVMNLFKQ
jgi:uncharacterized protein (TIGR03067 family)